MPDNSQKGLQHTEKDGLS